MRSPNLPLAAVARRWPAFLSLMLLLVACSGEDSSSGEPSSDADPTTDTASGDANPDGGTGPKSGCGEGIVDPATGKIDPAEYKRQAHLWDRDTVDCRLGPKFSDLHPGAPDTRKTAYEPKHETAGDGYLCKTYELSGTCAGGCDYGSTSGQVLFMGDDASDPGVDRAQNYAYERGRICESPQQGGYLGGPHPDPAVVQWAKELGRPVAHPNGFSQAELYETNGGILIFPDGLVGATGNQTAGGSFPRFQLPPNKVPTSVFVTGYAELALVTIWDTDALKGQVAIFALRADSPPAFSIPYFGLPNEAGFVGIHLLGYVDLPDMATPTSVAASGNNGRTPGGHAIGNEFASKDDPTKNIATSDAARASFARDDYERWVASDGHAVVASRWEGKVTFLDMRPLYRFIRDVYFTSKEKFDKAKAQDAWPYTFETNPEAKPLVVTTVAVPKPTTLRVGNAVGAFGKGFEKSLHAFVGNVDGEIRAFDLSAFAEDVRPVPAASVKELTKMKVTENITSMRPAFGPNDGVLIVGRGDRTVRWVRLGETGFEIVRTLEDTRIGDPVVADPSDRGPVVTVVDFTGKKLLNFRVGPTEVNGGKPPSGYGCGVGGTDASCTAAEFGGELLIKGTPFYFGTTNVN
jgi:hypothetical protein